MRKKMRSDGGNPTDPPMPSPIPYIATTTAYLHPVSNHTEWTIKYKEHVYMHHLIDKQLLLHPFHPKIKKLLQISLQLLIDVT